MIVPTHAKSMKQSLSIELLLIKQVQRCRAIHRELMTRAQDVLMVLTWKFGTIPMRRFCSSGTFAKAPSSDAYVVVSGVAVQVVVVAVAVVVLSPDVVDFVFIVVCVRPLQLGEAVLQLGRKDLRVYVLREPMPLLTRLARHPHLAPTRCMMDVREAVARHRARPRQMAPLIAARCWRMRKASALSAFLRPV